MAHPAMERSRANKAMVEAALNAPGVTFVDLYETYPDFVIDVPAEQQRLVSHPVIALQFPMYWYSTPALLKEWLDLVWLHGFAYGRGGTALKGKSLFVACTTSGDEAAYQPARRQPLHPRGVPAPPGADRRLVRHDLGRAFRASRLDHQGQGGAGAATPRPIAGGWSPWRGAPGDGLVQ